tara:strand:+ start:1610 stop:1828 length:219 start_codon:yes stop_codon:yes gene_type:complete
MDMNNFIFKHEKDVKLLNEALKHAEEHELLTEFVWSLVTHIKTYPKDTLEMAIDVAMDDWDLGELDDNDYLG